MKKIMLAPSLLSADFSRLAEEIRDVEQAGCDVLHIDVMDGHFVPNISIGPVVVSSLRKITKIPFDVHLMISDPAKYIAEFRKAGADWITIHVEAEKNVRATLQEIRKLGAKAGLSLKPKTPVEAILPYLEELDLILVMSVEPGFGGQAFMPDQMPKVAALRQKFKGLISVDGGIDPRNVLQAIAAGADVLVAGSAVFGKKDRAQVISEFREVAKKHS
ncbi:MAG TPA: ribulose-phosphate 3-epimerase [Candidatus Omnitrophota bacterium]|nr:ribulose-phosphate 3-epimerase [Candidatus Omnitrophota bacterium]HPS37444.1 ribulose-phosphate 3-epimerase [Candidatus Omnitrophota bacterium]